MPPIKEFAGFLTFVASGLSAACGVATYIAHEEEAAGTSAILWGVAAAWFAMITVFLAVYHVRK